MPANGVIYFDPNGKNAEELSVRFTAANGEVKAAEVVNIAGGLYKIEMPAGDEWMRFEIVAQGDDPATQESNIVDLYSVSNLVYDGTNNLFTLNADAPAEATAANGVWGKRTVQQIQGGEAFYYSIASSATFAEATNFIWTTKFMTYAGDEVVAEMELIEAGLYKMVAPEGTWDMFRIVLSTTAREVNSVYFEYDGVHNMFRLSEDASHYVLVGTLDVYEAPVVVVAPAAPTFSVAEGEFENDFVLEIWAAEDETRNIYILFTTDGTEPNAGLFLGEKGTTEMYKDGVRISETTTVKAMIVLYDENIENAADFVVSAVTTATYTKKEVEKPTVTATWSIEEGATLEEFTSVTITFTGVESAAAKMKYQNYILYAVNGDEETLAAGSGYMEPSATGVAVTFSLAGNYELVSGTYRIRIPVGAIKFNGDAENLNTEEYVLTFNYVKVDAPIVERVYTANPASNSVLSELTKVVVTYPDVQMIGVNSTMGLTLNQVMIEDGEVTASYLMAYLACQQIAANAFEIYVDLSSMGGPASLALEGTYSIVIPEGLISFSDTEVNKEYALYYTIEKGEDGPIVNVENVILSDIFVQDGTVVANGEFQIFTITGQNVTDMNGSLQSGVYVVRCGTATTKVIVK